MDKAAELAKSYKTSGESDRPDKYTEACGRENMQFQQLWVDPGDFSPCNKGGCTPPEAVQDRNHFRHGCHLNFSRSEEHTSELQSRGHLVCRLLLEKKKRLYLSRESSSHQDEST